ncbi:Dabb family protein [Paenibacillus sp. HJGM_3]|uniref:Dabb family protein n=1 Tax=Paenibacillus sp. HJGM_3 TaxID=3379816 RepID=UPI00385E2818
MPRYEHLVSFKFKDPLPAVKEQELLDTLRSFKGRIPGIVEVTAGVNVTEETDNIHGYTLGLRVTFEDRESLRTYGPHPVHQHFVSLLEGLLDNVVVIDYPIL